MKLEQRVAELEYQMYRLKRALFLIPFFGLVILSGELIALLHLELPTRILYMFLGGMSWTGVYLLVRHMTRQMRTAAYQYRQSLIESVPELNKAP